jgi:two-component system LytT family response regulator
LVGFVESAPHGLASADRDDTARPVAICTPTSTPASGRSYPDRLFLRDGGRMLCVLVHEIEWVAAAGNYVEIHTPRKTHLVRHTVKAMEAKLDPDRFLRVRPSTIVAVAQVEQLEARSGGDYLVTLRNGERIASSRGFRERVEQVFGKPPRRRRRANGG